MRFGAFAAALGLVIGCTGLDMQVRERAAFDFGCPDERIAVEALRSGYLARGCGKQATYLVQQGQLARDSAITRAVDDVPMPRADGIPDTSSVTVR